MSKEKPIPRMTELEVATTTGPLLRENEDRIDSMLFLTEAELIAGVRKLKERKVEASFNFQLVHHLVDGFYFVVQRKHVDNERWITVYCGFDAYARLDLIFKEYTPKKEGKVIKP
jgi:hypothetical protein